VAVRKLQKHIPERVRGVEKRRLRYSVFGFSSSLTSFLSTSNNISENLATSQSFGKERIRVGTTDLSFKDTTIAHRGCGVRILYHVGTSDKLYDSCDAFCSNNEAEHNAFNSILLHSFSALTNSPTKTLRLLLTHCPPCKL
jgi:hypothetical protein